MNISGVDPSGELGKLFFNVQAKNGVSGEQQQAKQVQAGRTNDSVALSGFAQEVRDVSRQASEQPEIRTDRVQAVQEALAKNQPLATSEQVAGSLITDTILNNLLSFT